MRVNRSERRRQVSAVAGLMRVAHITQIVQMAHTGRMAHIACGAPSIRDHAQ
jgi:hypothetical protein